MRWGRALPALCLAVGLAVPSACATWSPEREIAIGREASREVEQTLGLVDDPELQAYVDDLGRRLVRHAPPSPFAAAGFHFQVVDMAAPNAFALPGGWIYVSRGLLVLANSEAQLANVIGHEIGHVVERHSAERQSRATGVGLLAVLGAIAAGVFGGGEAAQAVGQLGQIAGAGLIASYSRDQEREADVIGQRIAAGAGFQPGAMAAFFEILHANAELASEDPLRPTFFDSHPPTPEREEAARARAEELRGEMGGTVVASRADYLSRIEGVLVGSDPAGGVVVDGREFLHPGFDLRLRFPPGWTVQNTPQAVVGVAPDEGAGLQLTLEGDAGDPRAAARAFGNQAGVSIVDEEPLNLAGESAWRAIAVAETRRGRLGLHVTWIPHRGRLFRLTGLAPPGKLEAHADAFASAARSLRGLRPAEWERIHGRVLRVVAARPGETLSELSERTANLWSLAQTAIANEIPPDAPLPDGHRVKVVVAEPYPAGGTDARRPRDRVLAASVLRIRDIRPAAWRRASRCAPRRRGSRPRRCWWRGPPPARGSSPP